MKLIIDIEADSLTPKEIWCIVCKNIDTGEYHKFREVTKDESVKEAFLSLLSECDLLVGHNILGYDLPAIQLLLGARFAVDKVCDTFIISKLADYSRKAGHSIDAYGEEFGLKKISFKDFSKWSQEMEDYCVRDVDICHKIYLKYLAIIVDPVWLPAIQLENRFQCVVNQLHRNGFAFDTSKATSLLDKVKEELDVLDKEVARAFPPKLSPIREIHPKLTQHGTLNKSDFRWVKGGDLSEFNGGPFTRCEISEFNASSHKQIIEVLHKAGWTPTERTESHKDCEREINRLKYNARRTPELDERLQSLTLKLEGLKKYGWKVNENNLSTLPSSAPAPARTLARRILYESRRRTLTEWLSLVSTNGRVHGEFQAIGAWTQWMSHQKPNMANIPNDMKEDGSIKLLGKELRQCWIAPKKKRLLAGVDAEGIQLRIFAHYVNDPILIKSLIDGRKENKTDPHNLNKQVLGSICKTRQAAKRFLYALLLGGGVAKFSQILECTQEQAAEAVDKFNQRYPGFSYLKREQFPSDAKKGYFIGLDGRKVPIPGDTVGERKHLCMSGYLQNGEAIIIKRAAVNFNSKLSEYDSFLVDIVHDEYQIEVPNNMKIALEVAKLVADSIRIAGEELNLNCPMAGSYWNDDKKDYTIGTNWYVTH